MHPKVGPMLGWAMLDSRWAICWAICLGQTCVTCCAGPKIAPNGSKSASHGPGVAQHGPKIVPHGPR